MHSICTLTGDTLAEQLDPTIRVITFDDTHAMIFVRRALHYGWSADPSTLKPWESTSEEDEQDASKLNQDKLLSIMHMATEEQESVAQTSDFKEVHNSWRDNIYVMYNHIFADVEGFIQEQAARTIHIHPPCHKVLAIRFPDMEDEPVVLEHTFDTSVFVIPAFISQHGLIEAFDSGEKMAEKDESDTRLGVFNNEKIFDVWFLKIGSKVKFCVKEAGNRRAGDIAAVLVYGTLHEGWRCEPKVAEEQNGEEIGEEQVVDGEQPVGK